MERIQRITSRSAKAGCLHPISLAVAPEPRDIARTAGRDRPLWCRVRVLRCPATCQCAYNASALSGGFKALPGRLGRVGELGRAREHLRCATCLSRDQGWPTRGRGELRLELRDSRESAPSAPRLSGSASTLLGGRCPGELLAWFQVSLQPYCRPVRLPAPGAQRRLGFVSHFHGSVLSSLSKVAVRLRASLSIGRLRGPAVGRCSAPGGGQMVLVALSKGVRRHRQSGLKVSIQSLSKGTLSLGPWQEPGRRLWGGRGGRAGPSQNRFAMPSYLCPFLAERCAAAGRPGLHGPSSA